MAGINDREHFVAALAVGNFRYSITVHNEGCTITVNGKRTQRLGTAPTVSFEFAGDGNLNDIKVEVA